MIMNWTILSLSILITLSATAHAGVATIEKWERNVLSVCWYTGQTTLTPEFQLEFGEAPLQYLQPTPERYRQVIQHIVTTEYTLEKVGIEFDGWHECNAVQSADIQLTYASSADVDMPSLTGLKRGDAMDEGGVVSHIGREHVRTGDLSVLDRKQRMFIHFSFVDYAEFATAYPSRRDYSIRSLSNIALHEFGHMAGLMHELERREDPRLKSGSMPRRYTSFDPHSVMQPISAPKTTLSPGDVHTLRCLYLYEVEHPVNPCKIVPKFTKKDE